MKVAITLIYMMMFTNSSYGEEGHHHHHHKEMTASETSSESVYGLDSEWVDQNGKTVKLSQLQGSYRVVGMIFTSCPSACPMLVGQMKDAVKALSKKEKEKIKVSLFSFDDENDTPEALKKFQSKMKLNDQQWSLYRADNDTIREFAAVLGVQYKKLAEGGFVHSNTFFLLNPKGEVVAKKDGLGAKNDEFVSEIKKTLRGASSSD